jgi:hypothetical protein
VLDGLLPLAELGHGHESGETKINGRTWKLAEDRPEVQAPRLHLSGPRSIYQWEFVREGKVPVVDHHVLSRRLLLIHEGQG